MKKSFCENNVVGNKEPIPDGSTASAQYLNSRYSHSNGQTVLLSDDLISVCEEYNRLVGQIDELTIAKECAANRIKHSLGENEIGLAGNYRVLWKQVNSTRLDSTRLKHENPEFILQVRDKHALQKIQHQLGGAVLWTISESGN